MSNFIMEFLNENYTMESFELVTQLAQDKAIFKLDELLLMVYVIDGKVQTVVIHTDTSLDHSISVEKLAQD